MVRTPPWLQFWVHVEEWDDVLGVALSAVFHLTQAAIERMQTARYGRIVQISSIAAQKGATRQANYSAAKAGQVGLTRAVAREVARDGITVSIVMPGPTEDSDMNRRTPADVTESLRRLIPMKRLARADDIAHAVSFLLDDRSGYLTGVVLPVDGGFTF